MERPRNRRGQFVKSRAPHVADDKAFVIIELDRKTGAVTLDAEFSTPAETFAACWRALELAQERFSPDRRDDD